MSDCIRIELSRVTLNAQQFRVKDYEKLIEGHRPHLATQHSPALDDNVCWFLTKNSFFKDSSVTIAFGSGRSSHTWRDFRWAVWFLNQYFTAPVKHTFLVSDESDGFERQFPLTVSWPYRSAAQVEQEI